MKGMDGEFPYLFDHTLIAAVVKPIELASALIVARGSTDQVIASHKHKHKNVDNFRKVIKLNVRESERATSNCCCNVSESIITHCSPGVVIEHFKTSFM